MSTLENLKKKLQILKIIITIFPFIYLLILKLYKKSRIWTIILFIVASITLTFVIREFVITKEKINQIEFIELSVELPR